MVHEVLTHKEWVAARKKHLTKEKEFTRLRDQLSKERRELPWELVEKEYTFDGGKSRQTLSDLFEGRSQLVIYHAMFNLRARTQHGRSMRLALPVRSGWTTSTASRST